MASKTNWKWPEKAGWQDAATLILGIWLIVSPWAVGFYDLSAAMWNGVLGGIVLALFALAALVNYREWEEWIDGVLGLWFAVSPWVLGFGALGGATAGHFGATINFLLVGLIVLGLSAWSVVDHRGTSARA